MEAIKETVASVIQSLVNKKPGVDRGNPEALFKKALTKRELGHIKFNYFKKGVLNVNVDSSSWLYNFNLHKEKILGKLNTGNGAIKDIRFRIGEIK